MGPGEDQLNERTVAAISQAVALWVLSLDRDPFVVLACDCRNNGALFTRVASEVLAGNGVRVLRLPGAQPTPVLCHATRTSGCSAGIIITASHNAHEYNGYKVYDQRGCQATDAITQAIKRFMDKNVPVRRMAIELALQDGIVVDAATDVLDRYLQEAQSALRQFEVPNIPLDVVYTPLSGAGGAMTLRLLQGAGFSDAKTVPQQIRPDGDFPTCPLPNPEDPQALALGMGFCARNGAELLLANNPDADRVGVGVMHGDSCVQLSGNDVALLLFDWVCHMHREQGTPLAGMIAYATVVTTPLLDAIARKWGVELRRTLTGFKYIGEQICVLEDAGMLNRFLIGLEESCGYLIDGYVRDKDGMSAAVAVAKMARWHKARGKDLCDALRELHAAYGWCSSEQASVQLKGKGADYVMRSLRQQSPKALGGTPLTQIVDYASGVSMPGCLEEAQTLPPLDVLEYHFDGGKALIRPSGTEPKVKAYVFAYGESEEEAEERLRLIMSDIRGLLATI